MTFQKGNQLAKNRLPKGMSVRALIRSRPLDDNKRLIAAAYRFAIAGDVHWAEWLMKHGGIGAYAPDPTSGDTNSTTIREIIIRETHRQTTPAIEETDALEGDPECTSTATLSPARPSAPIETTGYLLPSAELPLEPS